MDVWPRRDLKGQRYTLSFLKSNNFFYVTLTVVFEGRLRRIVTYCIALPIFMPVVFLEWNVLKIQISSPFSKCNIKSESEITYMLSLLEKW